MATARLGFRKVQGGGGGELIGDSRPAVGVGEHGDGAVGVVEGGARHAVERRELVRRLVGEGVGPVRSTLFNCFSCPCRFMVPSAASWYADLLAKV